MQRVVLLRDSDGNIMIIEGDEILKRILENNQSERVELFVHTLDGNRIRTQKLSPEAEAEWLSFTTRVVLQ